jgi:hypothetical protein
MTTEIHPMDISSLDRIRVASPCPVSWYNMAGDERVRHCSHCNQHVFNLSDMSRDEAEALIRANHGGLCVRYYQRADGTVMTSDCPEARRRKHRLVAAMALGLSTFLLGLFAWWQLLPGASKDAEEGSRLRDRQPFRAIFEWLAPEPPPVLMGAICPPPQVPEPPNLPDPN